MHAGAAVEEYSRFALQASNHRFLVLRQTHPACHTRALDVLRRPLEGLRVLLTGVGDDPVVPSFLPRGVLRVLLDLPAALVVTNRR